MFELGYHPDWRWLAAGAVLAVALLAWSYRRARALNWSQRLLLLLIRLLTMAAIVICLLDPHLVQKISHLQPAQVAVLIDTSRSMSLQDVPGNRLEFSKKWLADHESEFPATTTVTFRSLDAPLENFAAAKPTAASTPLGDALEKLITAPDADRLTGIILCSDGLANTGKNPEVIARLSGRKHIPIFTLTAGTTNEARDIVVENVQVKRTVADQSPTRVLLEVRSTGYDDRAVPVQITWHNQILAAKTVRLHPGLQRIEMEFTPRRNGYQIYEAGIPPQPGEWLAANNRRLFGLEVLDRSIHVLYMEGTPSEWRYLKDAAETDPGIKVKALCQTYDSPTSYQVAGHSEDNIAYPVNHPTKGFPQTMEELLQYDVIIHSDIKRQFFSTQQLNNMVDFVEQHGGGFAMIGGYSAFGSGGYQRTELERIIPVAMEELTDYTWSPVLMTVPPAALTHPLINFGATTADTELIWTGKFPKLFGYNRVDRVKPGAIVLGVDPLKQNAYGPMIVLAAQEIGKGRSLAFTSDTTRAWGEAFETVWGEKIDPNGPLTEQNCDSRYYRQFWINAIRWLAAGRSRQTNNPVTLELVKTYCQPNEPVGAMVKLSVPEVRDPESVEITMTLSNDDGFIQTTNAVYDFATRAYFAHIIPPVAGNFSATATATQRGQKLGSDRQVLSAETYDPEMSEIRSNPTLMAAIAAASGGQTISATNDITTLAPALQSKVPATIEYRRHPLWDKSGWLALILALLSLEWILRRTRGLA